MTTWLINSAVIPTRGDGTYVYRTLSAEAFTARVAAAWLLQVPVRHTLGYEATVLHVATLLVESGDDGSAVAGWGLDQVRRESYTLAPGEEALVVRLDQRVADPTRKHEQRPQSWDYGLLRRMEDTDA